MKKILAIMLCAVVVAATSGCSYNDALYQNSGSSSQSTSDESESSSSSVDEKDYKDSLDGLIDYFAAKGYIENSEDKRTEMDASAIGAKSGKKFSTTYSGTGIYIELYAYDAKSLNSTADEVIGSVKSNGTFSIYGLSEVTAYLSDNGKYLMVYTDSSIDDENPDKTKDNYKHREQVISDFKAFKK